MDSLLFVYFYFLRITNVINSNYLYVLLKEAKY